jgi:hypothetical protein
VVSPVDRHNEPVAVGVDGQFGDCRDAVGPSERRGRPLLRAGPERAELLLFLLAGTFEACEAGDVGVDAGLLHDERVAGGKRLDLGEGQDLLAEVVDVAVGQVAAGDLGDERCHAGQDRRSRRAPRLGALPTQPRRCRRRLLRRWCSSNSIGDILLSEWWILVLLCQWTQLGLSFDLGTSAPGVGPIRLLDLLGLVESMSALPSASPTLPIDGTIPASMGPGEADCRVLRRFKLAHRGEQFAACLLAAATNLSADTAVVVVRRVAIALLGASTTCDNTCLDRGAYDADIGLGLTGHDPPGRVAHAGTVEVEPNAPHQLGHV